MTFKSSMCGRTIITTLSTLLLSAACPACVVDGEESIPNTPEDGPEDDIATEESSLTWNALYAGSTVTLGGGNNNAAWFVNMSNSISGYESRLAATITHGGLLTGSLGLDHLAIVIRGASFDGAFQQMGLPLQTDTFLYGEQVTQASPPGS